jgi:hypothetical protein
MEYVYILCSLASLFAFAGYAIDKIRPIKTMQERRKRVRGLISLFAVTTVLFWAWFYISPGNIIKNRIADRSDLVRKYTDGMTETHTIQGTFVISSWSATVPFETPFKEPPEVTIWRSETSETPRIQSRTEDKFTVKISSINLQGKWNYRAKGQLLSQITEER